MRYVKGKGYQPVPVRQDLSRGRAPSGMPKLTPAKRKASRTLGQTQQPAPKKQLPPARSHASLSQQASQQRRDQNGRFTPVSERGFWGKVKALVSGEMQDHIQVEQAELRRNNDALKRRQQRLKERSER